MVRCRMDGYRNRKGRGQSVTDSEPRLVNVADTSLPSFNASSDLKALDKMSAGTER